MICPKCKSEEFIYRKKGDHIGRFCKRCNEYLGWVKQTPEILAKVQETPKSEPLF